MKDIDRETLLKLIGDDHNHQIDYALLIKLIDRRNKQIDLEEDLLSGKSTFASSIGRDFLKELRDMEAEVCDPTLYCHYYIELARANELTANFLESYQCAYNAYHVNLFCNDEDGAYLTCSAMSEYAYALGDKATSAKWLAKKEEYTAKQVLDEIGYEDEVRWATGFGEQRLLDAERIKEALAPLICDDEETRLRTIAARRLRRNANIPLKKAQKLAGTIALELLRELIEDFKGISADDRFYGDMHDMNTDTLDFEGDDWMPTDRESGYLDTNAKMIYDGSVIMTKELGIFRVAYHMGKWYCLSGMIALNLQEVAESHEMVSVDDNEDLLQQCITKTEWLFDNGPTL